MTRHDQDQQRAVDRARQRLGALAESDRKLVGDIRHELDEQGAEQNAAERRQPADHDPDQKGEREREPEALGRNEADGERAQSPRDAGIERADAEARRLVERRIDAHRLGGDRLVADGDQRPPDASARQIPRRPVERRGADEADEIEPLVGVEPEPERRERLGERKPLRAAGEGVEARVAEDLRAWRPRARKWRARDKGRRTGARESRTESRRQNRRRSRSESPPKTASRTSLIRIAAP